MKIPLEFYVFGKQFWMACTSKLPTVEETIIDALQSMALHEKRVSEEFVSNMLNGSCFTAEMKSIWKAVCGKHSMDAKTTKAFFTMVQAKIRDVL